MVSWINTKIINKKDASDFMKIKNFCALKHTIKNVKKPTKWERIFAEHLSVRMDLYLEYLKDVYNWIVKKTNKPVKKRVKDLNWHFPKEIKMISNLMKSCSTSPAIWKMHIDSHLVGWVKSKDKPYCGDMEKLIFLHIAYGIIR